MPPTIPLVETPMDETRAALWSASCASVAPRLKPVHAATYPRTKALVGTYGNDCARRVRFTPAKARIIGEADGIIMATIITAHIAKRALRSAALQGIMLTMHMAIGSRAKYHI